MVWHGKDCADYMARRGLVKSGMAWLGLVRILRLYERKGSIE